MSRKEYEWPSVNSPPIIKLHSLNKHEVLEQYLRRYLNKLYSKARGYLRFSIVDGFAGGGIYLRPDNNEIHFGSPVLIMRLVRDARGELATHYQKEVELRPRFYFVEKKKQNINVLEQVLKNQGLNPSVDNKGGLIEGEFVQQAPTIISSIKSEGRTHKAVFILDQYGYTDVPMVTLREIFHSLPDAEVILTFAIDWLIDYLSNKPDELKKCQARLEKLGINVDPKELVEMKNGGQSRFLIQDILGHELKDKCGAKYFTRYFIQTDNKAGNQGHRSIWLVHMSQHPVARDEMAKVHWYSANQISTHAGFQGIDDYGLGSLGYTTNNDERLGQLNLDFTFDKNAEKLSIDTLHRQLPDIIWDRGPMPFSQLMELLVNHMPASSDMVRQVLNTLLTHQDIQVHSAKGVKRQRGNAVNMDDLIIPRRLPMFDYRQH